MSVYTLVFAYMQYELYTLHFPPTDIHSPVDFHRQTRFCHGALVRAPQQCSQTANRVPLLGQINKYLANQCCRILWSWGSRFQVKKRLAQRSKPAGWWRTSRARCSFHQIRWDPYLSTRLQEGQRTRQGNVSSHQPHQEYFSPAATEREVVLVRLFQPFTVLRKQKKKKRPESCSVLFKPGTTTPTLAGTTACQSHF